MFLYYFDLKKITAEAHHLLPEVYGDETLSERTCKAWFERFRNSDFYVRDKECPGQPKKFEDFELQELLDENSVQILLELSKVLKSQNACIPCERFIGRKGYRYHMSC